MSINIFDNRFKKVIPYLGWVILFIVLWFKSCSNSEMPKASISIKEVKGSFKAVKPNQIIIHDTVNLPSNNKEFNSQINQLLQENKALQQFYNEASDSLKKAIYNNAIAVKSFNHVFDNDTINIHTNGLVRGEVQSIAIDYKIKSRSIEIPKPKETVLRILAGAEIGNSKLLNNLTAKATLGFQNRKGNLLTVGYDLDKKIYIGYSASIFNIKGK